MNSGTIELKIQGAVSEVSLNRPEVLNAANRQWVDDLHCVLDELEATDGLRVIIVSGRGRSFCTGIDLKALASGEIEIDWFRRWEESLRRLEMLEAITIAKIHGHAIGGGLQVALACDLRIASEDSQLGLSAVLEGLIPGLGTYRLPRFIGLGRARRMILTGQLIKAREALEIGLVDWVVRRNELKAMTERLTEELMKGSRTAQYFSKRLATDAFEKDFDAFCKVYLDAQKRALESAEHRNVMEQYRRVKGF